MTTARFATICPGCSDRIEPGEQIGQIGLAYHCAECFTAWREKVDALPAPVMPSYPLSSQYEPGTGA